jgi:hypothetical protein
MLECGLFNVYPMHQPPMHIPCTDSMLEELMTCVQWATGHCCHIISELWQ